MKSKKVGFAVFLALVAIVASTAFLVLPSRKEKAATDAEIASQRTALEAIQTRVATVSAGGTDSIKQLFSQAQLADQLLPSTFDQTAVISVVPALANNFGVKLVNLAPTAPSTIGTLNYVQYDISASGTPTALAGWLNAMRESELLLATADPSVQAPDGLNGELSMSFRLRAFYSAAPGLESRPEAGAAPAIDPATGLPIDPAAPAIDPATGLPVAPVAPAPAG